MNITKVRSVAARYGYMYEPSGASDEGHLVFKSTLLRVTVTPKRVEAYKTNGTYPILQRTLKEEEDSLEVLEGVFDTLSTYNKNRFDVASPDAESAFSKATVEAPPRFVTETSTTRKRLRSNVPARSRSDMPGQIDIDAMEKEDDSEEWNAEKYLRMLHPHSLAEE